MFDIDSPEALFRAISRNADLLRAQSAKKTDCLIFVMFGLNHLREWIAPGYRPCGSPTSESERFYELIFDSCPSFQSINKICNHVKHLKPLDSEQTSYGLYIDDWPDMDSVESFDDGPPTGYAVDGRDVLEVIDEVISFYQREWFDYK